MRVFSALIFLSAFAALCPRASADARDKKTILTINAPIQVPGKVLPPGEYVVKLLESSSNRHIVQILNRDQDFVHATILAIPNYRLNSSEKSHFALWEMPAGQPPALRAWFYPGDNFGQEFAYPKVVAIKIAQAADAAVPEVDSEAIQEMQTAPLKTVDKAGQEHPLEAFVPPRRAPSYAEETVVAQASAASPAPELPAGRLPDTATASVSIVVSGVFAVFAALCFRVLARIVS